MFVWKCIYIFFLVFFESLEELIIFIRDTTVAFLFSCVNVLMYSLYGIWMWLIVWD